MENPKQVEVQPENTEQVHLLVCRCKACTTWEIGHRGTKRHHIFLLCKTCGLEIQINHLDIDDHHMLHWEKHER